MTLALLCVVVNGFFVAAEFALARVRPTSLEALARGGDALAEEALRITKQLDAYLTTCQLGITFASLALGWLGEPALSTYIRVPLVALGLSEAMIHGVSAALAFGVISLLHIVLGELVPKSLAIVDSTGVSRMTARPMRMFYLLMFPALVSLNALSNWLLRRLGVASVNEAEDKLSADELRLLVDATFGEDDTRQRTKRELMQRVLRATDRPVRALMVPRVDMYMLSLSKGLDQWMETIRKSGYSRYPVSEDGNPDAVVGYVYVKDLLLADRLPKGGVRALTRDVLFIPETCSVGDLLTRFQRTSIPLAVVVDEYGGTSGLVTVEDVVEELVGDLKDELDTETAPIELREDGTIIADGKVPLGDLPIDGIDSWAQDAADTVGSFILARLGRLAHPGDRLRIGAYEATVEDVRRRRIGRVAFRIAPVSSAPPTTTPPPPADDE